MTKNNLFDNINQDTGRPTIVNWENILNRIVDDYEPYATISHGVQKDAIQNGWDARVEKKKGRNWGMRLSLQDVGNGEKIVVFRDWGTTGLTGRVLSADDLNKDLPIEERWGRFENMAFTKDPTEDALGARGQGKFIFLAASKTKRIVYDTLREDGIYRFGARYFKGVTNIMSHTWEGKFAEDMLKQYSPGLNRLTEIGTRVIIDEPIDDLVQSFKNRNFHRMVSETWWEIISKFGAKININIDGVDEVIVEPPEYSEINKLSKDLKIYEEENFNIRVQNKDYRVKKLFLAYSPKKTLPEDIRGIAVQRGGMMVERLEPRYIPKGEEEKLFGYITFDKPLDLEMARAEASTHYTFTWRNALPREVKGTIDSRVGKFLVDIGVTQNPENKKNRKLHEAEQHAMVIANKLAKALGITGKGGGSKRRGGGGGGGGKLEKEISIALSELDISSGNLRVEFDEMIKNIQASVNNKTSLPIKVLIKIFMTFGRDDIVHEFVETKELIPAKTLITIGPFDIQMDPKQFPSSGLYYIRASLISLMEKPPKTIGEYVKGKIIDRAAKIFWLAEDPPEGGIWEDVIPVKWADTDKYSLLGEYQRGDRGGYKYYYNTTHPAFEAMNEDNDAHSEHIFRLLVQAVAEIDLESDAPVLFEELEVKEPNLVAREVGILLGKSLYEYYN